MTANSTISDIQQLGTRVIPQGGKLWLYGSRARGDYHDGSDWDLLVLIDKEQLQTEDYDMIAYPFSELGWNIGEDIRPLLYTNKEWAERWFTPFYHNVEHDKIELL